MCRKYLYVSYIPRYFIFKFWIFKHFSWDNIIITALLRSSKLQIGSSDLFVMVKRVLEHTMPQWQCVYAHSFFSPQYIDTGQIMCCSTSSIPIISVYHFKNLQIDTPLIFTQKNETRLVSIKLKKIWVKI